MYDDGSVRAAAFFSYARADDEHDQGYLTDLRRALSAEVGAQTGDDFLIFQDRDDILWGQRWQQRIEESIDSSTILFAVVTPRFLRSQACLEEIQRFRDRENRLGRHDLILPLYYMTVADWDLSSSDEIVRDLASRQYSDWRDFRFEPLTSPEVRRRVAELAKQIVSAVGRTSEAQEGGDLDDTASDQGDDGVGAIELMAESEDSMPLFNQTMVDFALELERCGEIASAKTADMERASDSTKPLAARLLVVRELAQELSEPAERMETLAADYLDQLSRVDGGIRALVELAGESTDADEIEAARTFAETLRELAAQAEEGLGALSGFRSSLKSVSQMSSSIRPVMRRIDSAVTALLPSRHTFRQWSREMDEAILRASGGALDSVQSQPG